MRTELYHRGRVGCGGTRGGQAAGRDVGESASGVNVTSMQGDEVVGENPGTHFEGRVKRITRVPLAAIDGLGSG